MKLNKFIVGLAALVVLTFSNCYKKFDDLELNPNRATTAPPGIVLNGIEWDFYKAHGVPWGTRDASNEQRWNQFYCTNYNYYGTNEYSWASFDLNYATLKNVVKMEQEAVRTGADANNPYAALGKFFRAFFFVNMTQRLGDIPMSEALKGLENPSPKYDSQKEIYKQALAWLDEANDGLATARGSLDGDFFYGGDLSKWQKAVNSYQLRVLISLSKKESDSDLNIKTRFSNILSNPSKYPVFAGMSDNLQFVYNSAQNKYPINPDVFGFDDGRINHSQTFLGNLISLKDPRVFVVAEPADSLIRKGLLPTQFEAYAGAPSGEDLADMSTKMNKGLYSFPSLSRYYSNYTAEPTVLIGYAELCFNIAEAAQRGWATGVSADEWYKKGISASMNFYGITDATVLQTYLNQSAVKLSSYPTTALEQILLQKYLAFNQNSGLEAFFNWRRTGVPTFSEGVGTGNSGHIPKRWLYPNDERTTNAANLNAALQAQFGGTDDVNSVMWLLK